MKGKAPRITGGVIIFSLFFQVFFLAVTSFDIFISCRPMDLHKFLFAMLAIDLGKNSFWEASKLIALEVWGEVI